MKLYGKMEYWKKNANRKIRVENTMFEGENQNCCCSWGLTMNWKHSGNDKFLGCIASKQHTTNDVTSSVDKPYQNE